MTKNKCTHDRYKAKNYMMASNAMKAMKRNEIVRMGMVVKICEDCGMDISHAKRVKVETFEQFQRELNR